MWNGGIDRALGDGGLLDSGWSQALANRRGNFFVRFPTDGANVRTNFIRLISGASVAQCEPAKRVIRRRSVGRLSND